jgi:hypothetical protein
VSRFTGPCLCGAEDCPRCFPGTFDQGEHAGREEKEERKPESRICRDTRRRVYEEDFIAGNGVNDY